MNGETTPRTRARSCDALLIVLLFVIVIAWSFVIPNTVGLVILSLYLIVLWHLSGVQLPQIVRHLMRLTFFFVFIVVINGVLVSGRPLSSPLTFLSWEGLAAGVYHGMRVVVLYVAANLVTSLVTPEGAAGAFAAALRPFSRRIAREVAFHVYLITGFLPLVSDEISRIETAQRFRGGGVYGGVAQRIRGSRMLLVPLLVSSIHRSEQLAMTVELRKVEENISRILPRQLLRLPALAVAIVTVGLLFGVTRSGAV